MTEHVLSALTKRRAELAGEAAALRARLSAIAADTGHLDAVIRQFDPDYNLASIRPKRPRGPDVARRGEMTRFVLGVLREAQEPVPTGAIAARLMSERGIDGSDRKRARDMAKRVAMALRHQERQGTVRAEQGAGRVVLWEVVR
jgi:hypothetical protein